MNYLAHLFLSEDIPFSRAGSLLGDFTNNSPARLYDKYDDTVAKGVVHHRIVDRKTDSDNNVNECVSLLFSRHRHYSRVIIDVCFDYFLLRNWRIFSDVRPEDFIKKSYNQLYVAIQSHQPFPSRFVSFVRTCISIDLLTSYRTLNGIDIALHRLSKRIKRPTLLSSAIEDIHRYHDQIDILFLRFFPSMIAIGC